MNENVDFLKKVEASRREHLVDFVTALVFALIFVVLGLCLMSPSILLPDSDRSFLIRKTSAQLSLSPAIVEKDYWLCLLLSYLFNDSPYKDSLLFKGGTCLSKCFDLIQRFSEDLDVSIAWDILAYSGNDPLAYRNRTQRKKFNDEARQETDDFVKGPFLASLDKGLTEAWGFKPTITPSSESIATLIVEFPHEFTTSYIRPTLLLEMGSLSAKGPVVQRQIVPMAASFYSFSPISVRCLAPERTFWEKISILYRETQRPSQKMTPRRYSRHFYDIYRLSFSPYYLSALSQPNILDDVILMVSVGPDKDQTIIRKEVF